MKKFSIFTAILLSLGMFVFSCSKVQEAAIQTPEIIEEIIDNVQPVEMTFVATVAAKPVTKSVDASGTTAWVAGEEIAVYYQKTDLSYATATATVGTPNGDGSAPISATLSDAKDGSAVKFVYPAGLVDASGDLDASKLAAQHGTIDDISDNFDAATASGTLVTDGTTCGTSAQISMVNQVLIGKFIPQYGGSPIDGITTLTISDGTNTYTVTPSAGTFGTTGIYVAMLPVDSKEVLINASTASKNYTFSKEGITLAVGNLYSNLAIPMRRIISFTTSSSNADNDGLRYTLYDAADGDIIEMGAGTYAENSTNYIEFFGKYVTVRAASGADVIIKTKIPVRIGEGSKAEFIGIHFDATLVTAGYEHLIYAGDADANNQLVLENCEIYNFNRNSSAIFCASTNKLASVSFNNCYIHDIQKSVFFGEGEVSAFSLTNSTIANVIATVTDSYWAGIFDSRSETTVMRVDHCTFYNCIPMNTDYGAISKSAPSNTSNCIFSLPAATDNVRAIRGASGVSEANYCMVHNYLKDSGWGIHSNVTKTNCTQDDPLFVDAANGDFTLGTGSPALTASATSGPIGDPRWY